MGIETLSGPLLRELIDNIDVYHIEVTAMRLTMIIPNQSPKRKNE